MISIAYFISWDGKKLPFRNNLNLPNAMYYSEMRFCYRETHVIWNNYVVEHMYNTIDI